MKPTRGQKERRSTSFKFTHEGRKSWFYLCDDWASFHQPNARGQHDVFGLPVKTLINALKKCGYIALFLCLPAVVEAKEVVIPYADFLVMLSKVEHKDKLLNQCAAERGILIKLNDENGTIKKLNLQQIEALEGEVEAHRKLGETQEQIVQAMEQKLAELTQNLESEQSKHKWYAIGGVGIGTIIGMVIMAVMH